MDWTANLISVEKFTKTPGPKITLPQTAKDIFRFFTPALLELNVEQSNKYAAECMGQEKYEKWEEITVEELCAYISFMLLMGVVHLPSLYDYWKNDEIYHCSPIASRISRNRFTELHRYFHFVDNSSLSPPPVWQIGKGQTSSWLCGRSGCSGVRARQRGEDRWGNDPLPRALHPQAIHAPQASSTRNQGMGKGRRFQGVRLRLSHVQWKGKKYH